MASMQDMPPPPPPPPPSPDDEEQRRRAQAAAAARANGWRVQSGGDPLVSAVRAPGNAAKAVGGAVSGALGPVSTADFDQDRAADALARQQLAAERATVGGAVPTVNAQGITAPQIDPTQIAADRTRHDQFIDALQAAARGEAPSAAAAAYQQRQQDIAQQMMGLAGQARGTAGVAARRDAIMGIGQAQQRASADTALLQAQEQAQARGQLGGALESARAADQGLAITGAGYALDANKSNAQLDAEAQARNQAAYLQGQQQNNQYKLGLGGQELGYAGLASQGTGNKAAVEAANKGRQVQLISSAISGISGGVAQGVSSGKISDERAKEGVRPDPARDQDDFLRALAEYS
ncbi:MAG TPA: hypothetical protein VFJ24_11925, partial [Gaiellales bacterium]|nr:hypothetical protein [Gaiellales bacterium]